VADLSTSQSKYWSSTLDSDSGKSSLSSSSLEFEEDGLIDDEENLLLLLVILLVVDRLLFDVSIGLNNIKHRLLTNTIPLLGLVAVDLSFKVDDDDEGKDKGKSKDDEDDEGEEGEIRFVSRISAFLLFEIMGEVSFSSMDCSELFMCPSIQFSQMMKRLSKIILSLLQFKIKFS
jgi:hypothetical protein